MGQKKSKDYMTFTNCVDAVEKFFNDNRDKNYFFDLRKIEDVRLFCLLLAPSGFTDENRYLRNWQLAELCDVTEQEMSYFRHAVKISKKKQIRILMEIQEICYAWLRRVADRECPKTPNKFIAEYLQKSHQRATTNK